MYKRPTNVNVMVWCHVDNNQTWLFCKGGGRVRLQPRIGEKHILERLCSSQKFEGTSWNEVGT